MAPRKSRRTVLNHEFGSLPRTACSIAYWISPSWPRAHLLDRSHERATQHQGILVLRSEDLDKSRVRPEFTRAMIEDLHWLGIQWQEGPDCGGPFAPYCQSERTDHYRAAFQTLREAGLIYPCSCSRQDVLRSVSAPHQEEGEPIYPGTCRHRNYSPLQPMSNASVFSWRFRVPEGRVIEFTDRSFGRQCLIAGKDFGDFVVWRQDDVPSYQLAVTLDDAAMQITEIVRGADLLRSTARQLLLLKPSHFPPPLYFIIAH